MIQNINSFQVGDQFKIGGDFDKIYKGKTFTVTKVRPGFVDASAIDHLGKDTKISYCFSQHNFDYYGDGVKRLGGENGKEKV